MTALIACGGGARPAYRSVPATTLSRLAAGCEAGVVRVDGITYAFGHATVAVMRGGTTVARISAPQRSAKATTWSGAAALDAPGGGRWAVGLADGVLWRVTSTGELEAVNERLGLGADRVLSIDAQGGTVVIGLDTGVMIARDAIHMMQFAGSRAPVVAASTDRVAIGRPSWVEVFDLSRSKRVSYPVEDVTSLAFLGARLVVRAKDAVYIEDGGALRRTDAPSKLRHLVVSGSRVWMLAPHGLFSIEGGVPIQANLEVMPQSRLCRSDAGDVWLSLGDTSALVSLAAPGSAWHARVAPVFERVCATCHLPGGEADLDLSTPAAWTEHAEQLRDVLSQGTMPPAGTTLTDADRDALLAFLSR